MGEIVTVNGHAVEVTECPGYSGRFFGKWGLCAKAQEIYSPIGDETSLFTEKAYICTDKQKMGAIINVYCPYDDGRP